MCWLVHYLEKFPEVWAARRQDDLVGGELLRVAGQGHVHEVLLFLQVPERGDDRLRIVLPAQVVLMLFSAGSAHGGFPDSATSETNWREFLNFRRRNGF